jgi:uncharacterized C2H2 Zn-finger protein
MTDPVEIAHSITIEAIRAGVNRPDEILTLFRTVVEEARGGATATVTAPPTIGIAEEDIRPEPEIDEEGVRSEPVVEPEREPEVAAEPAPLPSKAWREPRKPKPVEQEEPVSAHLSAEDIAASHGEEFIKCLECGQTKQQIKHHLKAMHQMSVEDYKEKWGLPDDYPVVAPATRRRFQERGRAVYAAQKERGTGLAAHPGPKKPKEQKAA